MPRVTKRPRGHAQGALPDRREFLQQGGALLAAASLGAALQAGGCAAPAHGPGGASPAVTDAASLPAVRTRLVASTWDFGLAANAVAWQRLVAGAEHPLDACEAGVMVPESDPAVTSVGYGGAPNAAGVVELDSAVMRGDTLDCGAVAALRNVLHPVAVARAVMDHTPHVLLAGEGALEFARRMGFPEQDMLSPGARTAWEEWQRGRPQTLEPWEQPRAAAPAGTAGTAGAAREPSGAAAPAPAPVASPADHDTIGMIALDRGRMATAVTTSGLAFKLPGRVGDSPIVGAGSYCDDEVGAAVSTGVGEEVIRAGGCVSIIEAMRRGVPARQACLEVLARVRRTLERKGRPRDTLIAFLVVSRTGEVVGAALRPGFQYAVTDESGSRLLDGEVLP
ncbi:MAG TPA: N(4)-(beta-N-acetylglucosaminyl)-L-asparaginase [Planctomycetota bacterium]|nr:N(4)-(beta-N-acetylglucosaminyl)-L-asparaginase [Planctomycetota bacterium]